MNGITKWVFLLFFYSVFIHSFIHTTVLYTLVHSFKNLTIIAFNDCIIENRDEERQHGWMHPGGNGF
jgi:hypothetical protein